VSCANTPRRACACQPENGGHDHFIAHTAQEWRERWYGSDPERGWSILQGRDVVAYIGGDESMSDAVRAIVDAHNAVIAKEQK
jgi:hypothetical protein